MPIYREDLDDPHHRCTVRGCTESLESGPLYFHSRCHPTRATWARFRGDVLTIECCVCRTELVSFVIASRHADRP